MRPQRGLAVHSRWLSPGHHPSRWGLGWGGGSGFLGGVDGREDPTGVVPHPGMLNDILEAEPQGGAVAQQLGDEVPRPVSHHLGEPQIHLRERERERRRGRGRERETERDGERRREVNGTRTHLQTAHPLERRALQRAARSGRGGGTGRLVTLVMRL